MAESSLPHYVIAETPLSEKKHQKSTPYYFSTTLPTTQDLTTRPSLGTTRQLPFSHSIFNPHSNKHSKISFTTTKVNGNFEYLDIHRPIFDPSKLESTTIQNIEKDEKITRPIYNPGALEDLIIPNNITTKLEATTPQLKEKESIPNRPMYVPSILESLARSKNKVATKVEFPTHQNVDTKDILIRPVYDPSELEDLTGSRYRINRPVYDPNRFTTTPQPQKVIKIKNNRPIFEPTRENTKLRRPVFNPNKEGTTQRSSGPKVVRVENNRPIYEGSLEARSENGPQGLELVTTERPIPTFIPLIESRIPYDKYQNDRITRPIFDPSKLEIISQSRNKFGSKIQRPIYDPLALDLENRNNFRNQKTSFKPNMVSTTEISKSKIHLPNLDPNKFSTQNPLRRSPVYERIKLKYPSTTEEPVRRISFKPLLSTIYPDLYETTERRPNFELIGTKLEELISSLTTTRKRYEESTGRTLHFDDVETNDINTDGRNNRRIDEVTEKEKTSTTEITEDSTVVLDSTTEDFTMSTNIIETTTFGEFTEVTTLETTDQPITTEISTNKTHINITTEIVTNKIECIDSTQSSQDILEERIDNEVTETTTDFTTTEFPTTLPTTLEDVKNVSTTVSSLKKIDDLEDILNITTLGKKEEDYEFDYNVPTLPPSLPNLRIIPFVAADAVVEEKGSATVNYPSLVQERIGHITEASAFQYFSPPAETEGKKQFHFSLY